MVRLMWIALPRRLIHHGGTMSVNPWGVLDQRFFESRFHVEMAMESRHNTAEDEQRRQKLPLIFGNLVPRDAICRRGRTR